MNKSKLTTLLSIGVIILGILLRLYKFDTIPFGLNHDGAQDALQAIDLIQQKSFKAYLPGGSGETLFKYYLGVLIEILGPSIKTIRFASTLISIITVPVLYLFIKELISKRVALFSTFLFSISGWHIILGRSVWRAITTPLFEIITIYFLVKALKSNRARYFLLMSIFLSFSLYTYNAARVIPIFIFGILIGYLFRNIYLKKKNIYLLVVNIMVTVVVSTTLIFPLMKYAKSNWQEFNSRLSSLSVLNRIHQEQTLSPLIYNLITSALIFNVRANGDDFFINQPLLDFPTSLLFLVGLYFCIRQIKKPIYFFAVFGLIIMLLPGILSSPNGNRNITTIPFVYLLAGVGMDKFFEFLKFLINQKSKIPLYLIIILCFTGILLTYQIYFGKNRQEIWGFYPETTVLAAYMKENLDKSDFYITNNYPHDALTFITYKGGNPFMKQYQWFLEKEDFLNVVLRNKSITFAMFNTTENVAFIPYLQIKFPHGRTSLLYYKDNSISKPAALLYIVEPIKTF